ncbi:hypothetical protein EIP91_005683 [Steccherinum ochraceum]|uniref:Cytochrome P450-dit2 n=1 Tax=Steccherinum ochraceum TaxID=92696 RepID=A0A4R0R748_9APHY|nr:hypothetical protein EIP91_005683 [Steccherinum ochraceum]
MLWNWLGPNGLRGVPTVGPTFPVLAYLSGLRYTKYARETLLAGYAKYAYTTGVFKVSLPDQWLVIVAGPKQLEELKKFGDDEVSLYGGIDELMAARHILGADVVNNPYHLRLIQTKLTRNLSDFHGVMKDEMWSAFDDCIGAPTEWRSLPALKTMLWVVSRTTNRVVVGLPLCRNTEFLTVATDFTLDVSQARFVVNMFPPSLKPVVAKLVNRVPSRLKKAYDLVGPTVEALRAEAEQETALTGTWDDKPNTLLAALVEEAVKYGYSDLKTVMSLLVVEFTALHTTAMSFTHALYYLAADPSLAIPLREEVEAVSQEENGDLGSKTAASKLKRIDSFLREAQRLNGPNSTSMWRKTLKPITFSTGITIPAGVFLSAAATATQLDGNHYENPDMFDPWRFVDANARSFATTSPEYITFGQGKHACPGRHFAAYEMKLMLAYIVHNFDVKFAPGAEGVRPPNKWIGNTILPDPAAHVLFKKRAKT